jgi:Ca2+-binding RTX toxin-like protein
LGNDTIDYIDHSVAVDVDLRRGTSLSTFGEDTFSGIENIRGSMNADNLTGDAGVNIIYGAGSSDLIYGDAGDDSLFGDEDNDRLTGGDGNDQLDGGYGNDFLFGGSGNDTFMDWYGSNTFEGDNFNGSQSDDTISYEGFSEFLASPIITIDLEFQTSYIESYEYSYFPVIEIGERTEFSRNSFSSIENVIGSNFDDHILGNSDKNTINALGGNDLISGGFGDDIIYGGDGNDTLNMNYFGLYGRATVSLESNTSIAFDANGNRRDTDKIYEIENVIGSVGNDEISGNNLNNTLDGGLGSDTLYGKGGDDTLIGGRGGDYLDGGDGSDTADYRLATDGLYGSLEFQGINSGNDADILISIENIIASEFDDQLFGNNKGNRIEGRNGDDFLYGQDGNDTLIGGKGNDQLYGGTGNDWLSDFEGSNILDGGLGSDYADFSEAKFGINASLSTGIAANIFNNNAALIFSSNLISIENLQGSRYVDVLEGNNQNNVINGGLGADTASYINLFTSHSVDANLSTGQAFIKDSNFLVYDIDTLVSIENLTGSSSNDTLIGNDQDNVLIGGAGKDRLSGGGGNDVIYAELGQDELIDGGDGVDTLHVVFTSGNIGTNGKIIDFDGASGFINIENVVGTDFSDLFRADSKNNRIDGGLGNDKIFGRDGNDTLKGGDGLNFINGGYGHNIIDGTNSNNLNNGSTAGYDTSYGLLINLKLENGNATLASSGLSIPTLIDDYINISSVIAGSGNDLIIGNDQDNTFWGSGGNDSIFASGGDDVIDGGSGFDLLEGGVGTDIFVFTRNALLSSSAITEVDTILDFGLGGNDKIDLRSFGVLNSSDLQIVNNVDRTIINVRDQNFTQQIILEEPTGGPIVLSDFIFIGINNPQTSLFESYASVFNLN